ncbi:MAG: nickel-dependent lactate racemase [Firmicutes bacterium]|nr:nickel-dependent lactate racemase [Bacillota bacterium]
MKVEIPYGRGHLTFEHSNINRIVESRISDMTSDMAQNDLVLAAMAAPIGSEPLYKLAQGKKNAIIIISDHTRPVPSKVIIPHMLRQMREGNPEIDITLLVATGCHRGTEKQELIAKLGEDIVAGEKIVVHDCDDEPNLVSLGTLPSGAELIVNKLAAECDLLVAEGFIEPHFFAGFSGGRKSILPGICSRRTVLVNHCSEFIDHPKARMGVLDGNPIHRDMEAAVRMAGLDYIVNVIVDSEKKAVAAFAGDPVSAHRKGCDFLMEYCSVPVGEKAGIVVTSNGGAPLDQNAYQAVKGMTTAEAFAEDGGVIIICAECADGMGGDVFYEKMARCESLESLMAEIMATPMDETVPDQWQYQILVRIMQKMHVIVVCDERIAPQIKEMKLDWAATIEEAAARALKIKGEDCAITVIPDGVSVIGKE